ncbi:MAG: polymerase subunit sigma-24, partial [Myxococcaceae bacterium]|nr:polymerase subunit sigma-24 [Myxococcaceae bacterium]
MDLSLDSLSAVVRDERTRLVATLVRRHGFDVAEESVDAAIEAALKQWPAEGVPASPRAWLLAVARRRAVDLLRHRAMAATVHDALAAFSAESAADDDGFADDRLRLVFTCCHPAIARESQVALALRWISGLSTEDVARAFCVPTTTMAQRLTRAKSKIAAARIPYEVPERAELPARVDAVLEVVYAIFNEGYVATAGASLQRVDLAGEAVRLAELLAALLPGSADARALCALLTLTHCRRDARCAPDGGLVPLDEQDRARWDAAAIARGRALLNEALALGPASGYAIEAAIQALHDEAPRFADTDFAQIVALYGLLRARTDAPVVALNEAVARSMVDGPAAALALVDALAREGTAYVPFFPLGG